MKTKICTKCKKRKKIKEFQARLKYSKQGPRSHCKKCKYKNFKKFRNANKEYYNKLSSKHSYLARQRNREWIYNYLRKHPCVDCTEENPVVLEFDHVRGKKLFNIASAITSSISVEKLEKETLKCEIRCSNCHKKRHLKHTYKGLRYASETLPRK